LGSLALPFKKDGILVSTFSDPYPDPQGNQVRYYGEIKFPFQKGSVPAPDDFVKTFSELITVQPPDDSGDKGRPDRSGQPGGRSPCRPGSSPYGNDAPPPPRPDAPPPTIAIGQTKDQVTAGFGSTSEDAPRAGERRKSSITRIMKVTFTNGKVKQR